MKIFANGFPKSGNHALVKALELLGIPADVNHVTHSEGLPERTDVHFLIVREPRNIVISKLRFDGHEVTAGSFLRYFRQFDHDSLVVEMGRYEPWLSDPKTVTVKYEDLIASPAEMRRIALAAGVDYVNGSFERLPGRTFTWNAVHSDWRTIWTPQVEKAWSSEGGPELLSRWGY